VKNFFASVAILLILGAVGWQVKEKFFPTPCAKPIPYNLGVFDTRFNISKTDFVSAVGEAENIWESSYGKDLFTYKPDSTSTGDLKINLVYDYRQATTKNLSELGEVVEENQANYDQLKNKLAALKNDYEADKRDFEARLAKWNRSSRTDKAEYDKLESMQNNLNNEIDEINALVTQINRIAKDLNLTAEKYNDLNDARGETFEEGFYTSDGFSRNINIYEFESHIKLVRVIAHELGHALGLEHVPGKNSIMYEVNQGTVLALSVEDKAALTALCGKK
jgi:predicted Zn-dependent protease